MNALVTFGFLTVIVGGYLLHKVDKTYSWFTRMSIVALTMSGVLMIWFVASVKTPPVSEAKVEILGYNSQGLVASFSAVSTRNCSIEGIDAFTINQGDLSLLQSKFIYLGKSNGVEKGFITVSNPEHISSDKITFKTRHFCPFGFQVVTKLEEFNIPKILDKSKVQLP